MGRIKVRDSALGKLNQGRKRKRLGWGGGGGGGAAQARSQWALRLLKGYILTELRGS